MPVIEDEEDSLSNGNERKAIDKGIPGVNTLNTVCDNTRL
jgi:hypothetical protein